MERATPGPWSLDHNDMRDEAQTILSDQTGYPVAEAFLGARGGECEANARLIAEAPAMRDFIVAALPVLRQYMAGDLNGGCKSDANGEPDRTTLDPDFDPLVSACEVVISAGERVLAILAQEPTHD